MHDLGIFNSRGTNEKKMADRQIEFDHMISNFARLLSNISLRLTPEDLSNIKLVLEVDGVLKQKTLDSLPNTADLFRLLHSRKIINEDNLNLLLKILEQINRHDCAKLIKEFTEPRKSRIILKTPQSFGSVDFTVLSKYSSRSEREETLSKSSRPGSNCSDDDKILYEKPIYYFEYSYRKPNSMTDKYDGTSKKPYNTKDKYEDTSEKPYRMTDKYENTIGRKVRREALLLETPV